MTDKKLFSFKNPDSDENFMIAVVAKNKEHALTLFDNADLEYEGDNEMEDLYCEEHDINVNHLEFGPIDNKWGVRNNVYFSCEGKCEVCGNNKDYIVECRKKLMCWKCCD